MIHNYALLVPLVHFAFAEYCSLLQWSVRGSESQRNLSDAASFHEQVVHGRCVFVNLEIVRLFIRKVQL